MRKRQAYKGGGSDNHAGNEEYLLAPLVIPVEEVLHQLLEVHVHEVVPHQRRVRHQVSDLELKEFGSGFLLVEQVKRVNLLQHLVLDDVAPD